MESAGSPGHARCSGVAPLAVVPIHRRSGRRVPLRSALLVDAPPQMVRAAIAARQTWVRAATASGLSLTVAGAPAADGALAPGDVVRIAARRRTLLFRVAAPVSDGSEVVRLAGLGGSAGRLITVTAADTLAGSLVTVQVNGGRWIGRGIGRGIGAGRARVLRREQLLLGVILLAATGMAPVSATANTGHPGGDRAPAVVVAGVVIRDDTILAARRTYPPELAGFWECPGGKVEPGESETDALARELDEELGISVTVGDRVGPEYDIGHGYVLHAYRAELMSGEPSPSVHDAVRWVSAGEVRDLAWLPSDAPLIPVLRGLLGGAEEAVTPAPSEP